MAIAVRRHLPRAHARRWSRWAPSRAAPGRRATRSAAAPSRTLAAADARALGPLRRAPLPRGARAVDRRRRGGDPLVRVLHRARREPRRGGADARDMNDEIDVRHVLPAVGRPGARALPRRRVPARRHPLHGRAASRARGSSRCPAPTTCRGRATRTRCSTRSSASSAGVDEHGEPEMILTTVLRRGGRRRRHAALRTVARFRGVALDAPEGRVRASFDGPARAVRCASALARGRSPGCARGVHTGECELRGGASSGPALEIARGRRARPPGRARSSPPRRCTTSSRGSGIAFDERGAVALPLAGASREWRLFAVR